MRSRTARTSSTPLFGPRQSRSHVDYKLSNRSMRPTLHPSIYLFRDRSIGLTPPTRQNSRKRQMGRSQHQTYKDWCKPEGNNDMDGTDHTSARQASRKIHARDGVEICCDDLLDTQVVGRNREEVRDRGKDTDY